MKYLRTSDLARAVGVHANTVRRYEEWGLIPPGERERNGYRRFTQKHLDCLRLARLIFEGDYPGRTIRHSALKIIPLAVTDDWGGALQAASLHQVQVQAEKAQAASAAALLEHWAQGRAVDAPVRPLSIGEAAHLLGVTSDVLRNWERSGLIQAPRQAHNGYRVYRAAEISRLRVIRMLARAGHSMMAILRMLTRIDDGQTTDLRQALDAPLPEEDVYSAADRWMATLAHEEDRARALIALIEQVIASRMESPA